MPGRWEQFHATGGQKSQWETGGYGSYRESVMTGGALRAPRAAFPVSIASPAPGLAQPPRVGMKPLPAGTKQRFRTAGRTIQAERQSRSVGGTIEADTPETPQAQQWGSSATGLYRGQPASSLSDIQSRLGSFAPAQATTPPVVPSAVRGTPLRMPQSPF